MFWCGIGGDWLWLATPPLGMHFGGAWVQRALVVYSPGSVVGAAILMVSMVTAMASAANSSQEIKAVSVMRSGKSYPMIFAAPSASL